ncbi:hypothetical protein JTB14_011035 [Gonioctena quinquepunctata]|nr:hypothetical protein JTB14_011035 [Gonioctena quinquepunctata]
MCTFSDTHKFEVKVFKGVEDISNTSIKFNVIHNQTCEEGKGLKLSPTFLVQDVFYLQRNGTLFKPLDNITTWVPFPYYCLETFILPTREEFSALVCYVPEQLLKTGDDYAIIGEFDI